MSVRIEPANQLAFKRPLTRLVSENLSVRNQQSDVHVAFKVKTTAPKQYCVRPNSGKIKPGETVQVQVLLQPLKEDPPKDFKCKDKFLVQSVVIPPEHMGLSVSDLWTMVERDARDSISEQKVRCVFLAEDTGADKKSDDAKGEHHTEDGGGSPPEYKETHQDPSAGASQIPLQNAGSVTAGFASSSKNSVDSSATEMEAALRRQLALAQEQIETLRKQTSELRQRRPDTANSGSAAAVGSKVGENVTSATALTSETFSVQIVAFVAVLSFLCGYIFF